MRAAILNMPNDIEIREIEVPKPAEGEVLIQVRSALTCGTDLKAFLRGHALIPMPGPFGHEYSGIVAEKGRGVKRFRVGDTVMGVHSAPCLNCPFCGKKEYNLCERIMQTKVLGAFAEYLLVPAHVVRQNLYRKPDSISFDEAAFLEPLSCVVHAVGPLGIGRNDTVLVIGAGPIGLLHLLHLKTFGAKVLMTGFEEERLRTAKALGAYAVFHPSLTAESIRAVTDGMGADYVFECTGQPQVWEESVAYARRGGTVVLFGGCKKGSTVTYDTERLHYDEITLRGTFHYSPRDVRTAFHLLKGRTMQVEKLISGFGSLDDVPDLFQKLSKGEGIKFAVRPNDDMTNTMIS